MNNPISILEKLVIIKHNIVTSKSILHLSLNPKGEECLTTTGGKSGFLNKNRVIKSIPINTQRQIGG